MEFLKEKGWAMNEENRRVEIPKTARVERLPDTENVYGLYF